MKKKTNWVQAVVFSLFILVFALLFLILPDREFSEQENRYLTKAPAFSFASLFEGKFTESFESYSSDQFPLRDGWIGLKSAFERALGKTENNGVYFCAEDTIITRFDEPNEALVAANVAAVNGLAEKTEAAVYLSLIPGAVSIWADRLPPNAPNADQAALIGRIYGEVSCGTVDTYAALAAHAEEEIFYRTDHHWTTLGAYYGYTALMEALGLSPAPKESFTPRVESESFYGTVYSSSGVRWVRPDRIETWVSDEGITVTNYDGGQAAPGLVYDRSKLEVKDKYAMFFGGNTPLLTIETGAAGKPKLLLLRDSYSDSELPFLFAHFSEIHVMDLRYYKQSVVKYIEEHGIDTVLVNYSLANFTSDNTVFMMNR